MRMCSLCYGRNWYFIAVNIKFVTIYVFLPSDVAGKLFVGVDDVVLINSRPKSALLQI